LRWIDVRCDPGCGVARRRHRDREDDLGGARDELGVRRRAPGLRDGGGRIERGDFAAMRVRELRQRATEAAEAQNRDADAAHAEGATGPETPNLGNTAMAGEGVGSRSRRAAYVRAYRARRGTAPSVSGTRGGEVPSRSEGAPKPVTSPSNGSSTIVMASPVTR